MRTCPLVLIVVSASLLAVTAGCGGASHASASAQGTVNTSAPPTISSATGVGMIAGASFRAGGAFAQYDTTQRVWWLVITPAGHGCGDATSVSPLLAGAVKPNVDAQWPAAKPQAVPTPGAAYPASQGITFIRPGRAPNTIATGIRLRLQSTSDHPGGHWRGSLAVAALDAGGGSYGIDARFDAVVCQPAA